MNWLRLTDPVSGIILAASVIPPLLLLYFLRLRRKPQSIACTLLWRRAIEDMSANAPFQRLRRSLLLLLQLLALLMLILAITQPQLQAGTRSGGRMVILIDNSASMNATDVTGESRLDVAKQRARALVESIQSSGLFGSMADEVMVIGFNERAEVYANFTTSRQALRAAIDSIPQTHAGTRIDEALKLARAHTTVVDPDAFEMTEQSAPAALELFSDGRIHDFAGQVPRGETMHYHPIGSSAPDNVAFAAVSAERPFDRPTDLQVFASLVNYNEFEVTCRVQLSVNGNVGIGGLQDITLEAAVRTPGTDVLSPGRGNLIFGPFEQPQNAIIQLTNLRDDDQMIDNFAWLVTPPAKRLRVAVVEPRTFLTQNVLEGMNLERLVVLSGSEYAQMSGSGGLESFDVIIFDGHNPDVLPQGRYLSLGCELPVPELASIGTGSDMLIADWQAQHPVLRFVGLNNLVIGDHLRFPNNMAARVIAEGESGRQISPVFVEFSRGATHVLLLGFNPVNSNWPWLQSYVIFLVNAVEYLGSVGEVMAEQALAPLEAVSTRLPVSATGIVMRTPDGREEPVTAPDPSLITWGSTAISGLYEMTWNAPDAGRQRRWFAVNLLNEQEGDLGALESLRWGTETVTGQRRDAAVQTPLWPYAIALCLIVLLLEWWVYHRRVMP